MPQFTFSHPTGSLNPTPEPTPEVTAELVETQNTIKQLNFAITQYEEVLQKLNSEFQNLIAKNHQLENDNQIKT